MYKSRRVLFSLFVNIPLTTPRINFRISECHHRFSIDLIIIFSAKNGKLFLDHTDQFPNRTSNNFFLRSIFLSSMSASIKKKSKPKSDKVATNNNKQQQTTNNKRPFFLPKINKVFLRPILQNLKGRSVLDKFFFENDPLDEPNQMPPSKKFYL